MPNKIKLKLAYKYLGGAFIPGVPGRDITKDEVHIYEPLIKNSPLYKKVEVKNG